MADYKLQPGEKLFTERRSLLFRKEAFEYIHTGIIDADGETWTTTELDEANINQVYNQYREKYGLPYPMEITALRKHYGLSAAKMSQIMGFGANQYRLYEDGCVPSLSNARTLKAAYGIQAFVGMVNDSRRMLGEKEYVKIMRHLEQIGDFPYLAESASVKTGYAVFSLPRITAAILFFIKEMGGVFKTKMNKLLFYADFLCYRRKGFGLTGIEYKAFPYGPVPFEWDKIYSAISEMEVEEYEYPDMNFGERFVAREEPDMTVFDDTEKEVLKDVADKFRNVGAGGISKASHKEKGWIENHIGKRSIDYSYAFELSLI